MNNYEERGAGVPGVAQLQLGLGLGLGLGLHKRVRMEADQGAHPHPHPPHPSHPSHPHAAPPALALPPSHHQPPQTPAPLSHNGLPLPYMDNGHQISYQPYATSYNAHYPPAEVTFGGYGPGGDLAGYASRSLTYAPPAHQAYPPPQTSAAAFVQQQQQQMLHSGMPTYEQQHHPHAQHTAHKPAWPPQPIMQPLQVSNDQVIKSEMKVKQEIKTEPLVSIEPAGPSVIAMHTSAESHPVIDSSTSVINPLNDDPPKIKIKTDLFKEGEVSNQNRRGVITESGEIDKAPGSNAEMQIRQSNLTEVGSDGVNRSNEIATINKDVASDPNLDMLGHGGAMVGDAEGGKSRISDSGNSTDSANKNKFQGFSASESSSSSSEDETKIPNEIYFGTPDISTYRPKMMSTTSAAINSTPKPLISTPVHISGEIKKRGRPKGSCNKPKPPLGTPGVPRPQVGRPRGGGGGHSGSFMSHPIRPFKRDFSGIRFRRRWSDDGLDSSHIPNEVYFGDVPVTMEILFNYYDTNAEREKIHSHQKMAQQTPGNVTLVYSSSDSSSDDSSDSDSSDTDNEPVGLQQPMKRGPGRPRGSKTINRRADGQRLSSGGSPGDKPPGITDMKKFLKAAGIDFDYNKLIDGATSNKERVTRLMGLLHAKGLVGPPSMEACRALYDGPPPRRRGPKPGTKRTPRPSISLSNDAPEVELTPSVTDEESRRVTRGQTSGKPRQRIVISSDEEDAHTPLSKLRTMRQ